MKFKTMFLNGNIGKKRVNIFILEIFRIAVATSNNLSPLPPPPSLLLDRKN